MPPTNSFGLELLPPKEVLPPVSLVPLLVLLPSLYYTCGSGRARKCIPRQTMGLCPPEAAQGAGRGWGNRLLEGSLVLFLPAETSLQFCLVWCKSELALRGLAKVLQLYLQKWSDFNLRVSSGAGKKELGVAVKEQKSWAAPESS